MTKSMHMYLISQYTETTHYRINSTYWWYLSEAGEKILHVLIMSLKLPTSHLSYSGQLVLCEQGVGRIGLYFPLPPEISLLCDGDSVGQSTCASHLIPLIHHRSPLRNKGISLSATAASQLVPANVNKAKKKVCLVSLEQWVHSRLGQIMFESQKCVITLTC